MTTTGLIESSLPLPLLRKGKVREVYDVDDETLLLVTSDRISAFDVVLSEPIPAKGAVLTQVSRFWFHHLADIIPSHYLSTDVDEIVRRIPAIAGQRDAIAGRSMLARKATPVMFECVIRGYISGSAWKEYSAHGTLAGEPLPSGMRESQRFETPIFSPATKAETGHDENITFQHVADTIGSELASRLRTVSMNLYLAGRDRAAERGIIIADTKFEFGHTADGKLILIDEVLTPDSSRFWPADAYEPGRGQKSFDKQPLRDYLARLRDAGKWNGEAPPPSLSPEIVEETSRRYKNAYERVTGEPLPDYP